MAVACALATGANAASGLYAWGDGSQGQLGTGLTVGQLPSYVNVPESVTATAAGYQHSLLLTANGRVFAWGSNSDGQLGAGFPNGSFNLINVISSDVIAIDGWSDRSFAIKNDYTLWAWGDNTNGELGTGDPPVQHNAPTQVTAITGVKRVSAGLRHTLALKTNGTVWAWGNNAVGQLGNGTTSNSAVPVQVSGLTDIIAISAGELHSMALDSSGTVYAWGSNFYGQIGVDEATSYYTTPWPVDGLSSGVYSICAGYSHSVAMRSNGTVWTWGRNSVGQLGDGSWTNRRAPVQVSGLTGVVQISNHCYYHVHAVLSSGVTYGWGLNSTYQVGDGTNGSNYNTPQQVASFLMTGPAYGVTGGYGHSLLIGVQPPTIQATIASSPSGRAIAVDGVNRTAPRTESWVAGSDHTVAVNGTTQSGAAGVQYVWSSWSDGGAASHTVTAPASNTTYTANFTTEYKLTVQSPSGSGSVSPAVGEHWYSSGTNVTLTATPGGGYGFVRWELSTGNTTSNPHTFSISQPVTARAVFAPSRQVTIATSPAGLALTVDGANYTDPPAFGWIEGSTHTITVNGTTQPGAPGVRYVWSSWSDGGGLSHSITVPGSNTTYTASFSTQFQFTSSPDPAGSGSISPTDGSWHTAGTVPSIAASQSTGYEFSSWSVDGSPAGSDNPRLLGMDGPKDVTAHFDPKYVNVTVQTSPSGQGLTFTADGGSPMSSNTFSWQEGSSHTLSVAVDQQQSGGWRYHFTSWSDGGAATHTYVVPSSAQTITASFEQQCQLTASVLPGGAGSVSPGNGTWHKTGSVISVSANRNTGYDFSDWSGDLTGSANPASLTMSTPKSVTANFLARNVSVTVGTSPVGRSFRVDGTTYTSTPSPFSWQEGSSHTLAIDTTDQAVAPGERYRFTSWSDGGTAVHTYVVPSSNGTVTASFEHQYQLSTAVSPGGAGTVSPADGSWHKAGDPISVSASRNTGYEFADWSGGLSGGANPATLTMDGSKSVTANFQPRMQSITVTTSPAGRSFRADSTTYAGQQTFSWQEDSSHTVAIDETTQVGVDGERFVFLDWSDGGATEHTYTVLSSDATVTASFTAQYRWRVTCSPAAGGSATPATDTWYDAGMVIAPEATPVAGYEFREWTGDVADTGNPASVTLDAPKDATAEYSIYVNVDTSPTGLTVSIDGTDFTAPQTLLWIPGDTHQLSANSPQPGAPGERLVWNDWSDSGAQTHDVSPIAPSSFLASFDTQYELTVAFDPTAGGSTTPSESTWHSPGSLVSVSASANPGYEFVEWQGDLSGSNNPEDLDMDGQKVVTAKFNALPVASAGPDQTVKLSQTVQLDATGSVDSDGWPSALAYQWTQLTGPVAVSLTVSDTAMPTFSIDTVGSYEIQVEVSDGLASDTDTIIVLVEPNLPPVADAGGDQTVIGLASVGLDGTASSDPDVSPSALSFLWTQLNGPVAVSLTDADTSTPSFLASDEGIYVFELEVADGLATATDTVSVTVLADGDSDGMPDQWEADNGLNPGYSGDAGEDGDEDGLSNIGEYENNTDPWDADSDDDGYSDKEEVDAGSDPNSAASIPPVAPLLSGCSHVAGRDSPASGALAWLLPLAVVFAVALTLGKRKARRAS